MRAGRAAIRAARQSGLTADADQTGFGAVRARRQRRMAKPPTPIRTNVEGSGVATGPFPPPPLFGEIGGVMGGGSPPPVPGPGSTTGGGSVAGGGSVGGGVVIAPGLNPKTHQPPSGMVSEPVPRGLPSESVTVAVRARMPPAPGSATLMPSRAASEGTLPPAAGAAEAAEPPPAPAVFAAAGGLPPATYAEPSARLSSTGVPAPPKKVMPPPVVAVALMPPEISLIAT